MKTWYKINNQADGSAEIQIFDEIGLFGVDATMFKSDLNKVKNATSIKLLLNSPGGSVFDGIAIYNMLKDYRDKLEVEVLGWAASIASVIAMAASKITMREGSLMMIHKPWTMAFGNSDEMGKTIDLLNQIEDQIIGIYMNRSELNEGVIKQMMKEETWMNGEQAVEFGFADAVESAPAIAASFKGKFNCKKEVPKIETVHEPELKENEGTDLSLLNAKVRLYELQLN